MPALNLFPFSEEDVRGWCDGGTFARADELQKAGHVLAPELAGTEMTADVLGTWSRMDQPWLGQEGAKLHVRCTCDAATTCRHAVAMALHWVRKPDAFRTSEPEETFLRSGAGNRDLTPEEHMSVLLSRYTMNDLRALAARRGLTVKGRNKDEYVERLAALLLQPGTIDAAVEGLDDGELTVLTLIDLLHGGPDANPVGVRNAFQALARQGQSRKGDGNRAGLEPALTRLEGLGLIIRSTHSGGAHQVAPVAVSRAPVPQALLDLLPDRLEAAGEAVEVPEGAVTLLDLMQIVAHEIHRGEVSLRPPAKREEKHSRLPQEWEVGRRDEGGRPQGKGKTVPASVQLLPRPSLIPDDVLTRLSETTGAAREQIEFAADLMVELDILKPYAATRGAPGLDSLRLQSVLTLDGTARRRTLASAWLALPGACDLRSMGDTLELHVDVNYINWYGHELPAETSLRRLLARMIGHLAATPRWYACSNLADLSVTISPTLLYRMQYALNVWWFTPAGQPDVPLRLNTPEGRREVYRAILGGLLRGPLRWLGMVELAETDGELLFRPRPAAAILAGREPQESGKDTGSVSLVVEAEPDGTPVISGFLSADDDMAHLVTGLSEPLPPSPQGVRYRLTGTALQRLFQDGITGPALLAWMERSSNNAVPESVRSRIERAFASFGTVRLYDDLTLLELGDDVLRRELDAVTGVGDSAIEVISPRLLAVDPAQAAGLLSALTKAGYRPRVLEDS